MTKPIPEQLAYDHMRVARGLLVSAADNLPSHTLKGKGVDQVLYALTEAIVRLSVYLDNDPAIKEDKVGDMPEPSPEPLASVPLSEAGNSVLQSFLRVR